ncbi:hypothetical protein JCM19046_4599 [Bacillus sp. JCM 19046]|nr:hypothetical protein JCM19046_4599 [Bacillus sp. JCM 19046]
MVTGGVIVLAACTGADDEEVTDGAADTPGEEQSEPVQTDSEGTVLAEDLQSPWNTIIHNEMAYIPTREGMIYVVEDGELTEQTVQLEEDVLQESESGLLGMVLHPGYQENKLAYLYHSYQSGDGIANRIVQVSHDEDEGTWSEEMALVDEIPGAGIHNGGRLAIGPDDKLYATTGDAAEPDYAQDEENLAGSILRMELDGAVPEDNPFTNSIVYSYGHRNPQGLAWLSDNKMYSSEHGQTGHDEINLIEAGNNYGWPEIEGDEMMDGMETPIIHSGNDTWAPSGIAVHNDQLYIAGLRGEAVFQFNPANEGGLNTVIEDYGRVRDVTVVANSLYFITNNTDGRGVPSDTDDRLIEWQLE